MQFYRRILLDFLSTIEFLFHSPRGDLGSLATAFPLNIFVAGQRFTVRGGRAASAREIETEGFPLKFKREAQYFSFDWSDRVFLVVLRRLYFTLQRKSISTALLMTVSNRGGCQSLASVRVLLKCFR